MSIKEEKKHLYEFMQEQGVETKDLIEFVGLLDDFIEIVETEKEKSYDAELQRTYHLIYNQAVSAAREAFMNMEMVPTKEETGEKIEEIKVEESQSANDGK